MSARQQVGTNIILKLCAFIFSLTIATALRHNASDVRSSSSGKKLQNLCIVFRHGDRTPTEHVLMTSVPHEKLWPAGRGQLTDKGVLQAFKLGKWLRREYNEFLPINYNVSDFYLRSTDYERTLMTAQAVTAGIYHDSSSPLETYGLQWKPVPVHSVRKDRETMFSLSNCGRLPLLWREQTSKKEVDEFISKHNALFELINNQSLTIKIDRHNIWKILDDFVCMRAHDIPLPSWCTEEIFQEMHEVAEVILRLSTTGTTEILKLETGVFLKVFTQHLKSLISGHGSFGVNGRYLDLDHTIAFSAHDLHVNYLLGVFKALNKEKIPYTGAVIFELLGQDPPSAAENYRLRLRYKHGYSDEIGEYRTMAPCAGQPAEDGCPLPEILQYTEQYLLEPEDYSEMCLDMGLEHF